MKPLVGSRRVLSVVVLLLSTLAGAGTSFLLGVCGPFADVAGDAFCPFVLEIFYLGTTTGTTATTYDPTANVSRLQMAAFLSRTVDGALKRGSRRAALDQFWTAQNATVLGLTTVGSAPALLASDGADVWVANHNSSTVSRVRASDGKLLETWTGASFPTGVLSASIGAVLATLTGNGLGNPHSAAFDGQRVLVTSESGLLSLWKAADLAPLGGVSIGVFIPVIGACSDGVNFWITENNTNLIARF